MLFLDVMYYGCHLFYKNLLTKVSPSIQPSIMLGALFGYPMAAIVDCLYIYIACEVPNFWLFFVVGLSGILLMFHLYEVKNRKKRIIKDRPRFFSNKRLNLFTIIFIVIIALSILFIGGPVGKYLLRLCY
ncbi:hypothetical protein SAMN05216556_1483 [Aequorivita viscosa]|uniref:Uncharacterized protein n=1 Tax=Aequorivita viscosa TaxID=797419 RepID=A0A1M6PNF7_9FLAO|nr:hypothetical protein SAMN05216556_1483 [Aequorivita viscosa]SHK09418.1 hypothetical protein SAMN04487908_1539 [Aequorivita viscosa]